MTFGKIDYINLLPFHVFIKKSRLSLQFKRVISKHKSYPSDINKKFMQKKIDAAFISSIRSKYKKSLDVGIVANKEVWSVIVLEGSSGSDIESESSNALAKLLGVSGEVAIGDKALKLYLEGRACKDLATLWYEKYKLPFVFARFCYNAHGDFYKELTRAFLKQKVKIPQYILKDYAKKRDISAKNINRYLKKISYNIKGREKLALKKYLSLIESHQKHPHREKKHPKMQPK